MVICYELVLGGCLLQNNWVMISYGVVVFFIMLISYVLVLGDFLWISFRF